MSDPDFDFAEAKRSLYESLSPERRAKLDAHRAREAELDVTRRAIPAVFGRIGWKKPGFAETAAIARGAKPSRRETVVVETWEKPVEMRIEPKKGGGEILRFHKAVTGEESWTLDEDFVAGLSDSSADRFDICWGSPDNYDSCSVACADVLAYIREMRPHLVHDRSPGLTSP